MPRTWSCIRSDNINLDELHPCFYCGQDIEVGKASHCSICGYLVCPHCVTCRCRLLQHEKDTLDYIHTKYCKNINRIKLFKEINTEDWMSKRIVGNMTKALMYCSSKI